jgi:hypothetical protein
MSSTSDRGRGTFRSPTKKISNAFRHSASPSSPFIDVEAGDHDDSSDSLSPDRKTQQRKLRSPFKTRAKSPLPSKLGGRGHEKEESIEDFLQLLAINAKAKEDSSGSHSSYAAKKLKSLMGVKSVDRSRSKSRKQSLQSAIYNLQHADSTSRSSSAAKSSDWETIEDPEAQTLLLQQPPASVRVTAKTLGSPPPAYLKSPQQQSKQFRQQQQPQSPPQQQRSRSPQRQARPGSSASPRGLRAEQRQLYDEALNAATDAAAASIRAESQAHAARAEVSFLQSLSAACSFKHMLSSCKVACRCQHLWCHYFSCISKRCDCFAVTLQLLHYDRILLTASLSYALQVQQQHILQSTPPRTQWHQQQQQQHEQQQEEEEEEEAYSAVAHDEVAAAATAAPAPAAAAAAAPAPAPAPHADSTGTQWGAVGAPRVVFVGVFMNVLGVTLAGHCAPGSQGAKYMVKELLLRGSAPLLPLRRYRAACGDGLVCNMLVDRKVRVMSLQCVYTNRCCSVYCLLL